MNVVDKYRLKRIARMEKRYGTYHGVRFDDDDDKNGNGNGGSSGGGHGNTRIPYGLCQREGITIEKDWSPKDAWNALAGKGYSASAVYKELKATGKVGGGKSKTTEKPKMSVEDARKVIDDHKSKRQHIDEIDPDKIWGRIDTELSNAKFERNKAQYALKKALEAQQSLGDKTLDDLKAELEEKKKAHKVFEELNDKLYARPDRGTEERKEWDEWLESQGGYSAVSKKIMDGYDKTSYQKLERDIKYIEENGRDFGYSRKQKELEELEKIVAQKEAEQHEYYSNKKQLDEDYKSAVKDYYDNQEKYREAVLADFESIPNSSKIREYADCKQKLRVAKSGLSPIETKLNSARIRLEFNERSLAERTEALKTMPEDDFRRSWYEESLVKTPKLISDLQEKIGTLEVEQKRFTDEISAIESRMKELKGKMSRADAKEWKRGYDMLSELDTVQEGPFSDLKSVAKFAKSDNIKYVNPRRYTSVPNDETIIKTIAGGDETGGSCASLAFAYLANKAGYEVRDFRGGASQKGVARDCCSIIKVLGATSEKSRNDIEACKKLFAQMEDGKEYYLVTGRHAAIIRKKGDGHEYLELQNGFSDGWFPLNDGVLKNRFAAKTSHVRERPSYIIDGEKITSNPEVISYMGYINTADGKEKRGRRGGVK